MAKRQVDFNAQAFWDSIKHKKSKRKLKGARIYLERKMAKGPVTEEMNACLMFLKGVTGNRSITDLGAV